MLIYFFLLPALTSASAVQNLQEEWPICDKDFLNGQYSIPHNLYCDRFFSCVNGSTLLMQCHDGFAYAPFLGCKLLHEVDCGNRTKLQQPNKSETCPRLYGLYEDPQGCGKFISCYNGTATPGQCPDSLAFDANGKYCRTPTDEEKKKCSPAPAQEEPNKSENCPSLYGLYDDPQGCGKYISCYNGIATPGQCPDSLAFDANGKYCRTPTEEEKKKCSPAPALEEPHKSESCPSLYGLYDDPQGCGKYISCYNGTATPGQCPDSLAFDANGKYCRPPTDEEKKKCSPAPALLGCTIGSDGINQGSCMWFQCPASAVFPFGDHSRYPYPGHCHYYIMCFRDGNIKIGSCPPGLAFNPGTLICEAGSTVQSCNSQVPTATELPSSVTPSTVPEVYTFRPAN